nr:unnamed protein product [Digitaria exilis]
MDGGDLFSSVRWDLGFSFSFSCETYKEPELRRRPPGIVRRCCLRRCLTCRSATGCDHLLLPFVPVRGHLRDAVESFLDCQFDLFIEIVHRPHQVLWCKGAPIGWYSDDNKPYLKQRAFTSSDHIRGWDGMLILCVE